MTRFFIADTQAAAQAIIDKIDSRARELAGQAGRLSDGGDLIGKNTATGQLDPAAQTTDTWSAPRQRLDGKWCVIHPETAPITAEQLAYVTQDLSTETVAGDPDDGTWFPLPQRN